MAARWSERIEMGRIDERDRKRRHERSNAFRRHTADRRRDSENGIPENDSDYRDRKCTRLPANEKSTWRKAQWTKDDHGIIGNKDGYPVHEKAWQTNAPSYRMRCRI